MSVYNHTVPGTVAAGQPILSADVLQMLSDIDAAIGDKTTLTTTAKSTIVAALLEMLANSWVSTPRLGSKVVTQAKIGDNAVGTGQIAASAVTLTELANFAVSGAKHTTDSHSTPNSVWDPHNEKASLKLTAEWGTSGHTLKWYPRTSQAALDDTFVWVIDSANPLGPNARTLQFRGASASALGAKFLNVAESGWKAGDVISGMIEGNAASGTFAVNFRTYDAKGVAVGAQSLGTGLVFSGTNKISNSGFVIDANAVYVLMQIERRAGTTDFNIYQWWAGQGLLIPDVPGISAAPVAQSVPRKRDAEGRHLLPETGAQLAKILGADGTSQHKIGFFGDSWVVRDNWRYPMYLILTGLFGVGGPGWVGFGQHHVNTSAGYKHGFTYVETGTWNASDRQTTSLGPDLYHLTSSGTGGTITLASTTNVNTIDLYYYRQAAGGTITYAVDGGGATTLSTAGAAGVQKASITGLSNAVHTVVITVTVAGSDNVVLLGADLIKAGNGVSIGKLGAAGANSTHLTQVAATPYQDALTALGYHLAILEIATNDKTGNIALSTYYTNLVTWIGRVRTALPRCDIILVAPADTFDSSSKDFTMAQYSSVVRTVAAQEDVACFDLYANAPSNSVSIARGVMEDTTTGGGSSRHLTDDGGRYAGARLVRDLIKAY